MIDLHSHIIFGVDDGPDNLQESISLIEDLYSQGVKTILATPHRRRGVFDVDWDIVKSNFINIKEIVSNKFKELKLFLGSEIYIYSRESIIDIENGKYPTLAGSNYVLVEFPYNIGYTILLNILNDIFLIGKLPILAHVERYNNLFDNISKLNNIKDMGCIIQVNANSILKKKIFDRHNEYKNRATNLLRNNLIDIIASDAHNLNLRKPRINEAFEIVKKKYGINIANKIFFENSYEIAKNFKESNFYE